MRTGTPPLSTDPSARLGDTSPDESQTSRGVTTRNRSFVVIGTGRGGPKPADVASQSGAQQPRHQRQVSSPPLGSRLHLGSASIDTPVPARRSSELEECPPPWDREPNMGGFPTPEYAAEEHLWYVFAALSSGNVKLASEMDSSFLKEVAKPIMDKSMIERFTANIYGERLRLRVKEMTIETLEAYHQLAWKFPDKANPLVESVGLALKTEIQRRDDAKLEKLQWLAAADTHMKEVIDALRSNNDLKAGMGVENFVKAMQPPNSSTAISDGAAFDMYKDRLNKRLINMPQVDVEALAKGVKNYLSNLNDPVVEGIRVAAEEALQQRLRTRISFGSLTDGPSS